MATPFGVHERTYEPNYRSCGTHCAGGRDCGEWLCHDQHFNAESDDAEPIDAIDLERVVRRFVLIVSFVPVAVAIDVVRRFVFLLRRVFLVRRIFLAIVR
jgi:hypothetical protein